MVVCFSSIGSFQMPLCQAPRELYHHPAIPGTDPRQRDSKKNTVSYMSDLIPLPQRLNSTACPKQRELEGRGSALNYNYILKSGGKSTWKHYFTLHFSPSPHPDHLFRQNNRFCLKKFPLFVILLLLQQPEQTRLGKESLFYE